MEKEAKNISVALYYVVLVTLLSVYSRYVIAHFGLETDMRTFLFVRRSFQVWLLMRWAWRQLHGSLAFDTEMKVYVILLCVEAQMTLTPLLMKLQF